MVRGGLGEGRRVNGGGDGKEEISREELRQVIRKLKDGKVMGEDGIPNKVWKYGGEDQ